MKYYIKDEPLLDNEMFSIYGKDEFRKYADKVMKYMLSTRNKTLNFFNLQDYSKVRINLYEDKESIIKCLGNSPYQIGKNAGFFKLDENMIFCYSDFKEVDEASAIKNIAHEFIHLVYMNSVQEKSNNSRIVWMDEGLAQILSGQKDNLLKDDEYKTWFKEHILSNEKTIPKIAFLKQHGNKYGYFCDMETRKYNGYDFSYIMVRYLNETLSKEEFQTVIRSKQLIERKENNLVYDAVSYYANKLGLGQQLIQKSFK